jgi:hypothetical protein
LAVPGVIVTATGPQGSKSTITESQGRFSFPFVTPGTYAVRAELQGFKTLDRKDLNVSVGQTVDVPIKMEIGGVAEMVNVTAAPPLIDPTSTTAGAVISSDLLERVPVGRRISDTLYLAPGVSSGGTVGQANPSVSGASGLENQYVIDGVNVTNQGYGALGSFSITFGSLGNATPFDFIKDVEVKTAGYEAEFGQSTGGVVNVVTKSGTNDLRGSAFAYDRPQQLEGDWTQVQTPNGTVQTLGSHTYDGGIEGGAPILRNRAFFFGAIDPSRDVRTFEAPQDFPLLSLGGVDRTRDSLTYAAKGTVQINSSHRVDVSFFGDPSSGLNGPQRPGALLNRRRPGAEVEIIPDPIYGQVYRVVRARFTTGERAVGNRAASGSRRSNHRASSSPPTTARAPPDRSAFARSDTIDPNSKMSYITNSSSASSAR